MSKICPNKKIDSKFSWDTFDSEKFFHDTDEVARLLKEAKKDNKY